MEERLHNLASVLETTQCIFNRTVECKSCGSCRKKAEIPIHREPAKPIITSIESGTKYISAKGMERVLRHKPVRYHSDPNCFRLKLYGAEIDTISSEDIAANSDYLQPCVSCHPDLPKKVSAKRIPKEGALPPTIFPVREEVVIWRASDGREFSGKDAEREALWYELELTRTRRNGR